MSDIYESEKSEKIRKILSEKGSKIYFLGIGGVSMSSLSKICIEKGLSVYGSDIRKNEATAELEKLGAKIFYGGSDSGAIDASFDLAVYSLAIPRDNPELRRLRGMGVPLVSRAELLGAIGAEYETLISVSGSHGKTTASAMAHTVFSALGASPTSLIGAEPGSPFAYVRGDKKIAIFEGCEYGGSFLEIHPHVQILLNLDLDHVDCYPTLDSLKSAFARAASLAKSFCVVNADDPNLKCVIGQSENKIICFSKNPGYSYRYEIIRCGREGSEFRLLLPSGRAEIFSLSLPGEFNVVNAVAALVAADALGYDISQAGKSLLRFSGVERRLERLGNIGFTAVFYDYAHHPKEISAVREALSMSGFKSICALFSPHTFSRTKALFDEFAAEFCQFEFTLIAEIYAAREKSDGSVSSEMLVEKINNMGGKSAAASPSVMISSLEERKIDCLVLMGAGDLSQYKSVALEYIRRQERK